MRNPYSLHNDPRVLLEAHTKGFIVVRNILSRNWYSCDTDHWGPGRDQSDSRRTSRIFSCNLRLGARQAKVKHTLHLRVPVNFFYSPFPFMVCSVRFIPFSFYRAVIDTACLILSRSGKLVPRKSQPHPRVSLILPFGGPSQVEAWASRALPRSFLYRLQTSLE